MFYLKYSRVHVFCSDFNQVCMFYNEDNSKFVPEYTHSGVSWVLHFQQPTQKTKSWRFNNRKKRRVFFSRVCVLMVRQLTAPKLCLLHNQLLPPTKGVTGTVINPETLIIPQLCLYIPFSFWMLSNCFYFWFCFIFLYPNSVGGDVIVIDGNYLVITLFLLW